MIDLFDDCDWGRGGCCFGRNVLGDDVLDDVVLKVRVVILVLFDVAFAVAPLWSHFGLEVLNSHALEDELVLGGGGEQAEAQSSLPLLSLDNAVQSGRDPAPRQDLQAVAANDDSFAWTLLLVDVNPFTCKSQQISLLIMNPTVLQL